MQVPLMFKKILHLKPAAVFPAGKSLEDPDYCWFECWASATFKNQILPLHRLPVLKADRSGLTEERREISDSVITYFVLLLEV